MFGKSMEIDNDSFFNEYWNEENLKKIKPNPEPVKGNEIILCQECKYGTEEDGPSMDCYWSRELFGYDHVCLRMDMGCYFGEKKKEEECY